MQSEIEKGPAYGAVGQNQDFSKPSYTVRKALVPGILMFMVALLNGIALILTWVLLSGFAAWSAIALGVFLPCSILAIVSAKMNLTSQWVPVLLIISSVGALIYSVIQMTINGVVMSGTLTMLTLIASHPDGAHAAQALSVLMGLTITNLVAALIAFIISIILMVFASKVVCACCKGHGTYRRQ